MGRQHWVWVGAIAVAVVLSATGYAAESSSAEVPKELQGAGITEKLGNVIRADEFHFTNEEGKKVALSDYFKSGKAVFFSFVYYGCPNLCTFFLNGLLDSLKEFEWNPGQQFEVVTLSIDPTEGPELAAKKKKAYLEAYGRKGAEAGWHFLTGEESQIKRLASELGFGYRYDEKEKQYAHSAALFVLTPEGKLSRILYGIQFRKQDLKLAVIEASNGKVGTIIERFLLFCYRYDPLTRTYSVALFRIMQTGGAGTVLIFGGYLAVFWGRQRRRGRPT